MKTLCILLCLFLLTGCSTSPAPAPEESAPVESSPAAQQDVPSDSVTEILLSDSGITVDGGEETSAVYTSRDIIYYEDRDFYDSGNPYGEGEDWQRHSAEEADAHTVVNITAPGTYQITGKLSAGQIRIDLGEEAYDDPNAVVELILKNADITCTVAPAILFQNVYECDGNWSVDTAKPDVDTSAAGANLVLVGENTVSGSHVAKIFKDKEGEKKLWKQDGAIYSYMSMNVSGLGFLEINADNEGIDTELHLTINSGGIFIYSGNDGINTNEDGVSVTTINGGSLIIYAGLDKEGDGVDSNGYLTINGGTVVTAAHPASDAGLDSDLGSFIHGGTVLARGSAMDWAESDSKQVTMNLQFASQQKAGSKITVTKEDGTTIFSFQSDNEHERPFSGLILSHPEFALGETYYVYIDGVQMAYSGTDVRRGPGGFGGGQPPEIPDGIPPEGKDMSDDARPELPENGTFPEGMRPPEDMEPPEGMQPPENRNPPEGGFLDPKPGSQKLGGEVSTSFYMSDKVNAFSGVVSAEP